MPVWNRNEPLPEKRRVKLFVYDLDGQPASASTLFDGDGELLVDKGDGHEVAADGTLVNTDRPLVIADDAIEAVDTVNDRLTLTGHGLLTGDGPVQFTTDNTLPGGIGAATDYWVIRFDDDEISLATSLANALAGTKVDLTSAGAGTNTLVDTASTRRLNDGAWIYEASQAEINYRGTYFTVAIRKTGFLDSIMNVDLRDEQQLYAGTAAGGGASTLTLANDASATNDTYKDAVAIIVGGTGAGQANTVASYVGGTRVATMARAWATQPDNTSQIVLVPAPSGANPTSVADAVGARVVEGVHTHDDLMRLLVGIMAGTTSDYTTDTIAAKSLNGAKTRITWTVDEPGRLSLVIGDLT